MARIRIDATIPEALVAFIEDEMETRRLPTNFSAALEYVLRRGIYAIRTEGYPADIDLRLDEEFSEEENEFIN